MKKLSWASSVKDEQQGEEQQQGHPYGVQPWGNFYLKDEPEIRTAGLGVLSPLADDLVLNLLFLLPAADLARLGLASKALYCFVHTTDLWKSLVIEELEGDFMWCGSWRETYLRHRQPRYVAGSHRPLAVKGFYSDFLHQPWFCASVDIQQRWLEVDNIDRRSGLTPTQFCEQYEARNCPVVLMDAISGWPALEKWSREYLQAQLAGRPVIVGNMPWRLSSYLAYCDTGAAQDEMPLYMFDKAFALASPQLAKDYSVPAVFSEDLFEVLGEDERPDYRWLIVGPRRSGSSFHVDPNATCAWNASVRGRKKWILFPPGQTPPGVYPSPDGADVAAPISLFEWLVNFYEEARDSKHPPLETITQPGEVMYVPRGWWHMVLNLDESVAVTHNYVSSQGLPAVLRFLKPGRETLVSGCCLQDRSSLHDRFVSALQQRRPEVLQALWQKQAAAAKQREAEHKLCQLFKEPQQQEQQQLGSVQVEGLLGAASSGFSFGFGFAAAERDEVTAAAGGTQAPGAGQGFSFGFSVAAKDGEAAEKENQEKGAEVRQQQQQQQQQQQGKRSRQEAVAAVAAGEAMAGGADAAAPVANSLANKAKRGRRRK